MEEPTFLAAMDRIIGGVEVQDHLVRPLRKGRDEPIYQDGRHLDQTLTGDAILQAAQSRWRGQGLVLVYSTLSDNLEQGIITKGLVIVEVFIAQGDAEDPLSQECSLLMDNRLGVSWIWDTPVEGINQPEPLIDLTQE
jgi:hypothetical protein